MPVCGKCNESFCDQFIKGISLTQICNKCVVTTQFITKTSALTMGARARDLVTLDHHREHNPHYWNAAPTYLFLEAEVSYISDVANRERVVKECARRSKAGARDQTKRARQDDRQKSLEKRSRALLSRGFANPPTPGLVSGDFCSPAAKTPKISVSKLSKRVHLYQSLAAARTSQRANLFRFACVRGLYSCGQSELESRLDDLHHALDRVVLNEGHRIMTFLSPEERHHVSRAIESMGQELHGLPVVTMGDGMYALCQHAKTKLEQMRATDPAKRKKVLGKAAKASFNDVLGLLVQRNGHIIPSRIEYYGVPRVFDMLCNESTRSAKENKVYECLAELGIPLVPRRLMETLEVVYVGNQSLVDFRSVEKVLRIFRDKRMLGMNSPRPFDLLHEKMNELVYVQGKSWDDAADEAARSDVFIVRKMSGICACGNPSAKLCVSNKCGLCCGEVCPRHSMTN